MATSVKGWWKTQKNDLNTGYKKRANIAGSTVIMKKVILFLIVLIISYQFIFNNTYSTYSLGKPYGPDGLRLAYVTTYRFVDDQVYQKWDGTNHKRFYEDCKVENKNNWVCDENSVGVLDGKYFCNYCFSEHVSKMRYVKEKAKWDRRDHEGLQYIWPVLFLVRLILPGRFQI